MANADGGVYSRALMDHVSNPDYKYKMGDPSLTHEGINPSCGDDLVLDVRLGDDGKIAEVSWTGHGCAVSQGSADMMSDLMVGETPEDARKLCHLFGQMIRGEQKDPDTLDELDEASCLESISHMPARVKCAELAWRTLDEMLAHPEASERTSPTSTEDGTDENGSPVAGAGAAPKAPTVLDCALDGHLPAHTPADKA